jgi:hypothetical protein
MLSVSYITDRTIWFSKQTIIGEIAMNIITDHKWKNFLYGYELTKKERKDFDYMTDDEIDCQSFVRYKKTVYSLNDFMRSDSEHPILSQWNGSCAHDSFSGVLIKVSNDCEQYMIATYLN